MIDYHLHTYLCRHAQGTLEDYVAYARQRGLKEIGFADHFPLYMMDFVPQTQVTMESHELETYLQMVEEVAAPAHDIKVKTGIEIDYIPEKTEKVSSILEKKSFDYIIGSVHFMGDWDFTHPYHAHGFEECNLEEVYGEYFDLVTQACKSGLIDIIGHVDGVKKFGYRLSENKLMPYYREVAEILKDNSICLEVNTAGIDAPVKEMYPDYLLLKECVKKGVSIVLGSDAHSPEQVGRHFPRAMSLLSEAGVKEIITWEKRKPFAVSLETIK